MTVQIQDSYIVTLFETKFHKNKLEFVDAIKTLFASQTKAEQYEYGLLKAYEKGDLSIGQVADILSLSKKQTLDLLEKYKLGFVNVDSEYLDQEFKAFE